MDYGSTTGDRAGDRGPGRPAPCIGAPRKGPGTRHPTYDIHPLAYTIHRGPWETWLALPGGTHPGPRRPEAVCSLYVRARPTVVRVLARNIASISFKVYHYGYCCAYRHIRYTGTRHGVLRYGTRTRN
eukprot:scaffold69868_cov18-Prasinocladus_malaysianus.AAC.1